MKTYIITLERTVVETGEIEIAAKDKKTAAFNAGQYITGVTWRHGDDVPFKVKAIEQRPEPQLALVQPEPPVDPQPDTTKRKVRGV